MCNKLHAVLYFFYVNLKIYTFYCKIDLYIVVGYGIWNNISLDNLEGVKVKTKIVSILKKQNVSAVFICIAGIVLNVFLNYSVTSMNLSVSLDTVGTILVAVLGGYLPGVIVGFATNIIKNIYDPLSMYYGILNVIIAVSAAYLCKKRWFKKAAGIIGAIFIFSLIGGGLGALIAWFVEGVTHDSGTLCGMIYATGHFNLVVSHVFSSLIIDLADKVITVLLVVIILKILPKHFNRYCNFTMWMFTPLADDKVQSKKKIKYSGVSLRTKIVIVLISSLFTIALVGTVISSNIYYKTLMEENENVAKGTAVMASRFIDGDRVDEFIIKGEEAEGYLETKKLLNDIYDGSFSIAYLYVYKITDKGFQVVFDIDTEDVLGDEPGSMIAYEEPFLSMLPNLMAGENVDPIITNDEYGNLLTAAFPVYKSDGSCACYAIADVDVDGIAENRNKFLVEVISLYLSFFILLCSIVMWITDYHVVYPINAITKAVDGFSYTANDQVGLDASVKKFRKLDVHTNDELEKLYRSLCQMTLNQAEQMRSNRRLADSTAKMQDGLIITMADMVENRDSDTGAHIQKTAAYVDIIVKGLKKKGYYAEKLTPKFMSDVVRSAPLHDVGKINISDEILNKPGKLTNEEFEIMKTHTTAGKLIIEHAISTVEGDSYLKEARNMAAYHHERWDGKGYPEGLHGEVIPLSARIMAVADVFDALTSPRVYKPAFSIEKALSILEEGKGTQFDPKCVEVFMEELDEVKVVLRKYNPDSL